MAFHAGRKLGKDLGRRPNLAPATRAGLSQRVGGWKGRLLLLRRRDASFGRMRITLIHAMRASIPPIEAAFGRLWPEARLANLLDDSLAADLAATGR